MTLNISLALNISLDPAVNVSHILCLVLKIPTWDLFSISVSSGLMC